jgi:hypothetical protein
MRTIGTYAANLPSITGDQWFLSGSKLQQTIRKVYPITGTGAIPHGITINNIGGFTKVYGTFVDASTPSAPIWYPLPYVDVTAANNQVSLTVDMTNINITAGAGTPPAVSSGFVILEWLSQV